MRRSYAVGEGLGVGPAACQWPVDFELACRWYEAQMPRLYDDFLVRALDIQQLARIAATSPSRQRTASQRLHWIDGSISASRP